MSRIKSDWRANLHTATLRKLMLIAMEGVGLQNSKQTGQLGGGGEVLIGVAGDKTLDTRGRQSDQSWCLVDVSVVAKVMLLPK